MTNRISSVAYAVDEIASDEKTASATVFVMRWCSCSDVASGRPTSSRFSVSNTMRYDSAAAVGSTAPPAGRGQRSACHSGAGDPASGVTIASPCGT